MKNTVFLSSGLLGWAWLTTQWLVGGILLLLVLIAKTSRWRWQISLAQFYRWGDVVSVIIIVLLAYLYSIQTQQQPIFELLKWLPAVFAPILLVQLFSVQQQLPLGTIFYSFRNREVIENRTMDFELPYAVLTILSGGAATLQNLHYFAVVVALMSGILWANKPRHSKTWAWLLIMIVAINLSYLGQINLRRLQTFVEYKASAWFDNWISDPFSTHTSIGDLGELKLSDSIEFRVKADAPQYLLQASYDIYSGKVWLVSNQEFGDDSFEQNSGKSLIQRLKIIRQFKQREVMLALPDGTMKISGLEGAFLEYHPMGAVKIINPPEIGEFEVFYTGKRTGQPTKYDLAVPKQHLGWLQPLSQQLNLSHLKPQLAAEAVKRYFQKNFRYSLFLGKTAQDADIALRDFILQRKAGHCEYFAAAATLLLRQAGIPARLANGYAMEEYDADLDLFIVRRRHAHAWTMAYLNGFWQIVDATPSEWLVMENNHASFWQPVSDWFSQQWLNFKQWRLKQTEAQQQTVWLSIAVALLCYLALRIFSARRQLIRQHKNNVMLSENPDYQGLDSEFYLIEHYLQHTASARSEQETVQNWVIRLQQPELIALYKLHYQLRFDPLSLTPTARDQFRQQIMAWLKRQKRN
jgi:protein-glutamine gamma-glutamyltransferase